MTCTWSAEARNDNGVDSMLDIWARLWREGNTWALRTAVQPLRGCVVSNRSTTNRQTTLASLSNGAPVGPHRASAKYIGYQHFFCLQSGETGIPTQMLFMSANDDDQSWPRLSAKQISMLSFVEHFPKNKRLSWPQIRNLLSLFEMLDIFSF